MTSEQPAEADVVASGKNVARHVAEAYWGAVEHVEVLCTGVYDVSTISHGGLVALLDSAHLPANAVGAARATGRLGQVCVTAPGDGGVSIALCTRSGRAAWSRAVSTPGAVMLEYWAAEEDCEALAMLASCAPVRDGAVARYARELSEDRLMTELEEMTRASLIPQFLEALERERAT